MKLEFDAVNCIDNLLIQILNKSFISYEIINKNNCNKNQKTT